MSPRTWTKLSEATRFENPWWSYKQDTVLLPSGRRSEYHYVDTPGSVMIVPVRDDGRLVMVRQYRYLNDRWSIEFPGGGVPRALGVLDAARKELREEAGIEAAELVEIGLFNPFNGVTNELCHVCIATGHRSVPAEPEDTEDCEVLLLSRSALSAMVASGEIWDGMTLAAWSIFMQLRPVDTSAAAE